METLIQSDSSNAESATAKRTASSSKTDSATARKPAKQSSNAGARNGGSTRPTAPAESYRFSGVLIERSVKLGTPKLSEMMVRYWLSIDAAMYYVGVFAPNNIRGVSTVGKARDGLSKFLEQRSAEMSEMLAQMTMLADESGISQGKHGSTVDVTLRVSSPLSTKMLRIISTVDAIQALAGALWIQEVISQEQHDEAVGESMGVVRGLHTLSVKMKNGLVYLRRSYRARADDVQARQLALAKLMAESFNISIEEATGESPEAVAKPEPVAAPSPSKATLTLAAAA